ncbi:MAG: Asp-tRNA(Asn)/Glu-tRNA(Gln) amidotransferase subunit GatC [Chloroflexi bacterium]|nr:Asp-tRNA(Asn)/Glu-tRNA(Gln) amidotransferase subunit GatC [Chloroflexota bacterium]
MSLTPDEVQHITLLARVRLDPEELERYRTQLSALLEHFQVLQEVDTEGVSPTGSSVLQESVMRDDEPADSLSSEDVLANAPNREDDYFRVRAVLEQQP